MKPVSANRNEWISEAKCKGMDVNLFYPLTGESVPRVVRDTCENCPVKEQCAEWSIHHEAHGYQGGLTPRQRQEIRQSRNIFLWEPQTNVIGTSQGIRSKRTSTVNQDIVIRHGTQSGYRMESKRGMSHCSICIKAHNRYSAWNKNRLAGTVPDVPMPTDLEIMEPMVDASGTIIENPKNLNERKEQAYKDFLAS